MAFLDQQDIVRRTCEIAVAELRYGRPVVLASDRSFAAIALDAVGERDYVRFAAASADRHSLYLTRDRSDALGLATRSGALVPLDGVPFNRARDLGYRLDVAKPQAFSPAPAELIDLTVLSSLALLLPALVVTPVEPGDTAFAGLARITPHDIRASAAAEAQFEIVARTIVPLRDVPKAEFVVFRGGLSQRDQVAIVVGDPDLSRPVPTRIHSSCLTGDLFGSLKCDCGDQLRESLRLMASRGGGILLYLDQEGRGTGIGAKMRAYGYQSLGLDTIDADAALGFGADPRRYGAAVAMLECLGVASVELLTNNPTKVAYLKQAGISVTRRTPVIGEVTKDNRDYLTTKAVRAGHTLDVSAIAATLVSR
ncbi:GTP cyclohydrolase II RibA [Fulvimarina sp. 2208YS6-2-32]|uniref:GTP cyclohydrolase-2 n=1 Tax=Fulvimarina uroteuthidis TaxID=3098149 RepID=A0ABU5I1Y5_9HYPH|nr:GTP cyclohydrolase II RibA [Fulvimarina sp. 2208YS6-2-32]MDY8109382.1 GTP cyclohydrolase II RibA [Fulvimarina sp. 2208YS6-2-32]